MLIGLGPSAHSQDHWTFSFLLQGQWQGGKAGLLASHFSTSAEIPHWVWTSWVLSGQLLNNAVINPLTEPGCQGPHKIVRSSGVKPMTATKILLINDIPEKRHLNDKISFFFRNSNLLPSVCFLNDRLWPFFKKLHFLQKSCLHFPNVSYQPSKFFMWSAWVKVPSLRAGTHRSLSGNLQIMNHSVTA